MLTAAISESPHIDKWFNSDEKFNLLYPAPMQALARKHWTPLMVARKAARFLAVEENARILDIGSGVGKFCIGAAHYMPHAFYTGVEQRKKLVDYAENAANNLRLSNVQFIHGNFIQLDFKNYDHFYFYNSFYENFDFTEKIDKSIDYSGELYNYYTSSLRQQLTEKPAGTRLATYHSLEDEVPEDYLVVGAEMDNALKFWVKL